MKDIIIYSTDSCSHCQSAKAYLNQRGFNYKEKNVQSDKSARQELMDKGYRGVPIIVINGIDIVGFDKEKMDQLLEL